MRYLLALLYLLLGTQLFAQETSAFFSGQVIAAQGQPVADATIELVHEPTGFISHTVSNSKGLFALPNLRPGGPYHLRVSHVGMASRVMEHLSLQLGNNPDITISLDSLNGQLREVVVTSARRMVTSSVTVGRNQLTTLPSIGRSLGDFTRLTPQSNNNSFAGSSFRYNNLTIDGAVNNDAIGFSNSAGGVSGGGQAAAAGAGTRTNPYSLDAIQEVQVQLAPFDVKLGNFTGGSVNAVTKSGTNKLQGSVYVFGRNQALVGRSVDGKNTRIGPDFHETQYGASLGGALKPNKAFFFVNFEQTRRQEPTFYNAGDAGSAISLAEAQQISGFLRSRYNYDPGAYGAYRLFTNSDKLFTRLDFNLGSRSTLMVRGIYTKGWGNNLERSSTNFQFGSTDFTQHTINLNLVAELKTKLSNHWNNQLLTSLIKVHEYRDFPGTLAPLMDIDNGRIWLGTWREASLYNMHQRTVELTDNLTYNKGIHKVTVGTHNELYNLSYGFVNSWNGRWEYNGGLSAFLNSNPSRIRGAFTTDPKLPNDRDFLYNNAPNPYQVNFLSVYGQDELTLSRKLKVTPGLRADYSFVGNQPPLDPSVNNTADYVSAKPTYTHTAFADINNRWLGKTVLSPRIGFKWDITAKQNVVVRGGSGIFVGRMPFAWLGYAYTLTGSTYGNIDWNGIAGGSVPLAMNPQTLRDTVVKYGGAARAATREVDVIDNNFKMPRVWRTNLAVDFRLPHGYKLILDGLYTRTLYDVQFQQINLKDSTGYFTNGPTQTPVYVGGKLNTQFSNAFFLTNTTQGYRYNLTAQLSKTTNDMAVGKHRLNLSWSAAYTYGMSKDLSNGIRNSFQSNYEVNPAIIPSNPQLAYSNFDLRHRVVGTASFRMQWNSQQATSLSFFYSGQSGSPYSLIYQSAPFSNGSNTSLPYIPASQSDIRLADYTLNGTVYTAVQQWADLNQFIDNDPYLRRHRGAYAQRNALRTPWNHTLDMKLLHEFKLGSNQKHSLQLSLDITNVLNLLSSTWGHINFVTNVNNYTVNFLKFAKDANGKAPGAPASGYQPTFNFVKPTGLNNHYYTIDPLNSRWQGQLSIRYSF